VLRISFCAKTAPNGRFPAPNFVFLKKNWKSAKFSYRLQFKGSICPTPVRPPLHGQFSPYKRSASTQESMHAIVISAYVHDPALHGIKRRYASIHRVRDYRYSCSRMYAGA